MSFAEIAHRIVRVKKVTRKTMLTELYPVYQTANAWPLGVLI